MGGPSTTAIQQIESGSSPWPGGKCVAKSSFGFFAVRPFFCNSRVFGTGGRGEQGSGVRELDELAGAFNHMAAGCADREAGTG